MEVLTDTWLGPLTCAPVCMQICSVLLFILFLPLQGRQGVGGGLTHILIKPNLVSDHLRFGGPCDSRAGVQAGSAVLCPTLEVSNAAPWD